MQAQKKKSINKLRHSDSGRNRQKAGRHIFLCVCLSECVRIRFADLRCDKQKPCKRKHTHTEFFTLEKAQNRKDKHIEAHSNRLNR